MFSWLWRGWVGDDVGTLDTHDGVWGTFMVVYAWFLGLQLLDLGTTLAVIGQGGIEANELGPAQAVGLLGTEALLAMKLIVMLITLIAWTPAVAWLQGRHATRSTGLVLAMILGGALVYTGVVFWNLAVLRVLLA